MKKKLSLLLGIAVTGMMLFGTTALAAPKAMPDGQMFDAEFYMTTYPDVAEILGTEESVLYKHWVDYGKKEGRLPYDGYVAPPAETPGNGEGSLEHCPYPLNTWIYTELSDHELETTVYGPYSTDIEFSDAHWAHKLANDPGFRRMDNYFGRCAPYFISRTFITLVGNYAEGTIYKETRLYHYNLCDDPKCVQEWRVKSGWPL